MQFSIGIAKFLFVFVLCVALWSRVEAENKITLTNFVADVPSNDIVDSWTYDIDGCRVTSTINIKKNCPGPIEADIRVYKGKDLVNTMNKKFSDPMKEFEDYNMCGSIDTPERDDDSCSIAEGDSCAKECDLCSMFGDMDPGDYTAECDFKQNDDIFTNIKMDVTIESG